MSLSKITVKNDKITVDSFYDQGGQNKIYRGQRTYINETNGEE